MTLSRGLLALAATLLAALPATQTKILRKWPPWLITNHFNSNQNLIIQAVFFLFINNFVRLTIIAIF
jgi:hypothetical protein